MHQMMISVISAALLLPQMALAEPASNLLAIRGATLIDGTGRTPLKDAVVVIGNGKVECVGIVDDCPHAQGLPTLDARDRWVIPGLIDSHIHWQIWYEAELESDGSAKESGPYNRLSPETAARAARIYLANGITTVIDTGGEPWIKSEQRQVLDALVQSGKPTPRLLYSGWVNRKSVDASEPADAAALTKRLLEAGADGIKIRNGLSVDEYQAIVAEAEKFDRPVYGHTYYQQGTKFIDYTAEAAKAGVDGVFHVLGISPVTPENTPSFADIPLEDWQTWWLAGAELWLHTTDASMDELIAVMTGNQTWLQPTLVTEQTLIDPGYFREDSAWKWSPSTWEEMHDGSPQLVGEDLATYQRAYQKMQEFVRRFHEAGGMLVAGTDGIPVPGFGLQEELRLLVETGIPPMAVLQSATLNAAKAWRRSHEFGTLEPGKSADLVILEGDPLADIKQTANIWRVVRNGVVHVPTELLAESVEVE